MHIKIQGADKKDHLQIYASFKDIEPSANTPKVIAYAPYNPGEVLRFKGDSNKVFPISSKFLYLTFVSNLGTEINVKPIFG